VPVAFDHLVMRLLEKRPADRPQRAEDVVHALDAMTTPAGGTEVAAGGADAPTAETRAESAASRHARRRTVIGVATVALFALLVAGGLLARSLGVGPAWLQRSGVLGERERILLADFRGPPSDTLLGAVMTEALRTDLGQSRAITLVSHDAVGSALQRMTRNPATRIDLSLARELATREGIKAVLDGEIQAVGTSYVLLARIVSADNGETLAALRETAANAEAVIPAIDRLSKALRAKAGESLRSVHAAPPLADVTTSSLPALRKYVQGYRAWHVDGDLSKGATLMEEAVALDSNFASAYAQLGTQLFNMQVNPGRMLAMKQKAFDLRDRLPEAERLEVTADYYVLTYGLTRSKADHDKALAANEALLDLRPDSYNALNQLGILYTIPKLGDNATSEKYFAKALALDSTQSFLFANLIRSQVNQGEWERARATIHAMGRRFPTHRSYHAARYRYAVAVGQLDSAEMIARELWNARRSGSAVRGEGAAKLAGVAMTRGKIAEAQRWLQEAVSAYAEVGADDQVLTLRVRMAMNDAWFLGRRNRAREEADALSRRALDSAPPADRPYELLASLYAMLGQQKRASEVLERMDRDRAALPRSTREFLRQPAEGEIALAEKRYDDAVRLFEQSFYRDCVVCGLPSLARAYDMMGKTDSAIAVYERYLSTPSAGRGFVDFWAVDPLYRARTLKRLGELYEARGAKAKADSAYTRFVQLWEDADPALQPEVAEARRRLAALRTARGT
jgi:tetratricopeptide (TPR) repeat protein